MRLQITPAAGAAFEWEADAGDFRIGRADSCALRFQGAGAKGVSWEHLEFRLADGATFVTDLGSSNGTYVDGALIKAATPVQIGSAIQLGRTGPRLEVLDLRIPPAKPAASSQAGAASTAVPVAQSGPSQPIAAPLPLTAIDRASAWFVYRAGSIATVVAIGTLAFLILRQSTSSHAPPTDRPAASSDAASARSAALEPVAVANRAADQARPEPSEPEPTASKAIEQAAADPWKQSREQVFPKLWLVVVEDPKTQATWPFATAAVIGERALLTTASVAIELATFLDRGWTVAVMRDARQARVSVKELRVHAAFQKAESSQQLYFDLALLFTTDNLGESVPLASPAELAELEKGRSVECLAIEHAGEALDRFQQLLPQAYMGKIFAITSLPPPPGGPRLLHLRGSFTEKAAGSPIVNERGHLVALYCEPAPATSQSDLRIHYAKVIEPEFIQLGLAGKDDALWVRPVPASPSSTSQVPAK